MEGRGLSTPTDIRDLVTTSDGSRFITAAEDGSIRLWTTDPLRRLDSVFAHRGGVLSLAILENDDIYVYSSGEDHHVRRWRVANDQLLDPADLMLADSSVHAVAVTPTWAAGAGHDRQLRVRYHDSGRIVIGDTGIEVLTMAVARDNRTVVVGGTMDGRGAAQVWRVSQSQVRARQPKSFPECAAIRSLVIASNKSVVLGGDDAELREWNWDVGSLQPFERAHSGPIHALVRASQSTILSGSSDGRVLKWSLNTRKVLYDTGLYFPGGVFALAALQ